MRPFCTNLSIKVAFLAHFSSSFFQNIPLSHVITIQVLWADDCNVEQGNSNNVESFA